MGMEGKLGNRTRLYEDLNSLLYRITKGSRRDIVRYGSLGIAISCLVFTIMNWKAMQYVSPKAVWNLLFGVSNSPSFGQNWKAMQYASPKAVWNLLFGVSNSPSFGQNEGGSRSARVQQFVNYISDLETSLLLSECTLQSLIMRKTQKLIRNAILRYGITHPLKPSDFHRLALCHLRLAD